eukprot:29729-Pelagococcus_subviridis.AAC.2
MRARSRVDALARCARASRRSGAGSRVARACLCDDAGVGRRRLVVTFCSVPLGTDEECASGKTLRAFNQNIFTHRSVSAFDRIPFQLTEFKHFSTGRTMIDWTTNYAVRGSPSRFTARAWADLPFKIFAP